MKRFVLGSEGLPACRCVVPVPLRGRVCHDKRTQTGWIDLDELVQTAIQTNTDEPYRDDTRAKHVLLTLEVGRNGTGEGWRGDPDAQRDP